MLGFPSYKLEADEKYRICKIEEKLSSDFFSPHQHQYFEMIFFTECSSTNIKQSIDFRVFPVLRDRMFFVAKKQIHQWLREDYDGAFKGYFIVFNESYIKSDKVLLELFDFLDDEPFLDLDESESDVALQLITLIQQHQDRPNKEYQQSLIEALLHFVVQKKKSSHTQMSINKKRFMTLRKLIDEHYKDEKQVSFYAKGMNISIKRLDVITKELTSLSVSELIRTRILLEAKRELSLGSKTVQDIATALGYHDPSYFSRFFKKYEGIAPSAFLGK